MAQSQLDPLPDFIPYRIKLFEKLKSQYNEEVAQKERAKINVTLDNDRMEVGTAWETTPAFIARQISKSLSERTVIARVDGELWDLDRPLEKSCRLELLDFEHPEGLQLLFLSMIYLLMLSWAYLLHRKESLLAFKRPCARGGSRAKIRMSIVHRSSGRRWILLRDGIA